MSSDMPLDRFLNTIGMTSPQGDANDPAYKSEVSRQFTRWSLDGNHPDIGGNKDQYRSVRGAHAAFQDGRLADLPTRDAPNTGEASAASRRASLRSLTSRTAGRAVRRAGLTATQLRNMLPARRASATAGSAPMPGMLSKYIANLPAHERPQALSEIALNAHALPNLGDQQQILATAADLVARLPASQRAEWVKHVASGIESMPDTARPPVLDSAIDVFARLPPELQPALVPPLSEQIHRLPETARLPALSRMLDVIPGLRVEDQGNALAALTYNIAVLTDPEDRMAMCYRIAGMALSMPDLQRLQWTTLVARQMRRVPEEGNFRQILFARLAERTDAMSGPAQSLWLEVLDRQIDYLPAGQFRAIGAKRVAQIASGLSAEHLDLWLDPDRVRLYRNYLQP